MQGNVCVRETTVYHEISMNRVDLSSASLKRLGKTDAERTVTGSEYSRRLRSR